MGIAAVLVSLSVARLVVTRADDQTTFGWNIAGSAQVLAADNSKIVLTGNGTFVLGDPEEVTTKNGTWQTLDPGGNVTGGGTFQVTSLVKFDLAPGAVGNPAIRAGLAFLKITYSDGSRGILVASCHLTGTPASVAEGISASKGFTNYWNGFSSPQFFTVVNGSGD